MTGTVDIQELKNLAEAALRRPLNAYHEASIEAVNFYRAASPSTILALIEENERLRDALVSIRIYANDTLSGRVDGPDDRDWQRGSVIEIRNRARAALKEPTDV